jgi:hypothetical protein
MRELFTSIVVFFWAIAFYAHDLPSQDSLLEIPDSKQLRQAPDKYLAVFEVQNNELVGKEIRNEASGTVGLEGWKRLKVLFPPEYRSEIVQFNVQAGDRWAGMFDGDGKNDVGRKGYRLSIADDTLRDEPLLANSSRVATARRGTLDWTLIHEVGHYICLKRDLIEMFSQAFDGDDVAQPRRHKSPTQYAPDGSPKVDGNFVTRYAERTPGDEETVETFTTYLTIKVLPDNPSLVAKKIMFFDKYPEIRKLREHIQSLNDPTLDRE